MAQRYRYVCFAADKSLNLKLRVQIVNSACHTQRIHNVSVVFSPDNWNLLRAEKSLWLPQTYKAYMCVCVCCDNFQMILQRNVKNSNENSERKAKLSKLSRVSHRVPLLNWIECKYFALFFFIFCSSTFFPLPLHRLFLIFESCFFPRSQRNFSLLTTKVVVLARRNIVVALFIRPKIKRREWKERNHCELEGNEIKIVW